MLVLAEDRRQRYWVHVRARRVQLPGDVDLKPRPVDELARLKHARQTGARVVVMYVAETDVPVDAEAERRGRREAAEDAVAIDGLAAPRPWLLVNHVVVNNKLQQALVNAL